MLFRQFEAREASLVSAPPFETPGRMYWMLDSDGRFFTASSVEFGSVLLKPDMLVSHFPSSYEFGLRKTISLLHRLSDRTQMPPYRNTI
eukprot:4763346-Pyramimonas_sp.AAC.1